MTRVHGEGKVRKEDPLRSPTEPQGVRHVLPVGRDGFSSVGTAPQITQKNGRIVGSEAFKQNDEIVTDRHPTAQAILEEVIPVVESQGEARLRIQDIIDRTGFKAPTIYRYFGSRDGLVEEATYELFLRSYEGSADVFAELGLRCSSLEEAKALTRRLIKDAASSERIPLRFQRVGTIGAVTGRPRLAKRIQDGIDQLFSEQAAVLSFWKKQGWMRQDVDELAAMHVVSSLFLGHIFTEVDSPPRKNPRYDELVEEIIMGLVFDESTSA